MTVKVLMPKGSDTMTEGKVLKWAKKEGDQVSTGETVVEIETDKVDMEVEAMGSGVLRKILVQAGKVVPVGELLALIAKPDEDISSLLKSEGSAGAQPPAGSTAPAPAPVAAAPQRPAASASPAATDVAPRQVGAHAPTSRGATPSAHEPANGGRVLASPLARRMAQEMGLDLNRIAGSGPAGRIVRQDVERVAALAVEARAARVAEPGSAAAHPPAPPPMLPRRPAPAPTGPEFYDEPLSSMRKAIATRLVQSKAPVPHFYLTIEVDMSRAKELRESAKALNPELSLSYNDIILKACAAALQLHPHVNASFQGEAVRYYRHIHLGVAVAVEEGGLITPVIRNCEGKSLQDISREAKDLIARARSRKLNPDEYTGATFSLSNLGMMGIEEFSAVINPPEGAILAVGAVTEKPVVVKGQVEVGLRCRMTLSCDHRVVDGATGAKFLQTLKQILENPVYLAF
ncbi:MAG: dihydrolipoamide acetyltransferase family protein [Terriglobia bacterium]|jgi:pyruvate dehydrogenase E2 component (dihydrolipoamide acetyltransferase)